MASNQDNLTNFTNSLASFLDFLAAERNASSHTISAYKRDVNEFLQFLSPGKPENMTPTTKDVRKWLAALSKKGLKRTSIARKLSSVRAFFKYLFRMGIVHYNPAEAVSFPVRSKPLPQNLTISQTVHIIEETMANDFKSIRDRAILELLYSTGMRVSELTGLDIDKVNLSLDTVRVMGKGRKERIIPFGSNAKVAIERYLPERDTLIKRLSKREEQAFFLNKNGGRLSQRSVQRIVSSSALKAGIYAHVTPHVFRHTMATHLLEAGADLRSIQELLGHSSVATTQKYTHLDMKSLRKAFEKAHPRASKKKTD